VIGISVRQTANDETHGERTPEIGKGIGICVADLTGDRRIVSD
jgi:hypothetical protein